MRPRNASRPIMDARSGAQVLPNAQAKASQRLIPRVCVRFLYTEPSGATLCRKIQHRPTREPRICVRFLYMGPSGATLCMQIQHRTTCEPRVCVRISKYADILGDGQTHIYIYI